MSIKTTSKSYMTRRCLGHCCRLFQIEDHPNHQSLWMAYENWKRQDKGKDQEGIHLLAPMLIPRGYSPNGQPLFTCKHLADGRHCTIYEHRPQMCRDLGTINTCTHKQCRLDPQNDH